jgi:GntR family transcriptional regulator/MocR family aminotransferase
MRTFCPRTSLNGRQSLALGIAQSVRQSILRGQLRPGEMLPSTRQLAAEFGVHRHTVLSALELLVTEGLLLSNPRRGFSVGEGATRLELPPRHEALVWRGFRIVRAAALPEVPPLSELAYPLHSATPDPALVPRDELKAAYAHVLRRRRDELFDSPSERGFEPFRRIVGDHMRLHRALVAREVMVTHGSQEAIALIARALLAPGDVVAVEDPGYAPAWHAFRAVGARVVGVPVDEHGLDVEALEKLLARRRVRLLYTTPSHHFPTAVTLSAARRAALLGLTAHHGVPILEDDYDHEYQYRGLPLAPLAADRAAQHVIYVGTLSKLVSSGVRLGFVAAQKELLDGLARLSRIGTRGNDPLSQAAIAAWMSDGGLERHLRRTRRVYAARRDALVEALQPAVRDGLCALRVPDGGLGLWARWLGCDSHRLALAARDRGILVLPEGGLRLREGRYEGTRLSFSRCTPERLQAAGAELIRIARNLAKNR